MTSHDPTRRNHNKLSTLINMNIYLLVILFATLSFGSWAQDDSAAESTASEEDSDEEIEEASKKIPQRLGFAIERAGVPPNRHKGMEWLAQYLPDEAGQWIPNADQPFFALWQPDRSGHAKGAVLIIHAEGEHPAWPQTTKPLHDSLPDYGWATMAISLPSRTPKKIPSRTFPVKVIKKESTPEDEDKQENADTPQKMADTTLPDKPKTPPTPKDKPIQQDPESIVEQRLTASLKFLHDKGQFNVAIMGSGIGAIRAHKFMTSITPRVTDPKLKDKLEKPIRAFILYNARNQLTYKEETYTEWFLDPEVPVIDIFTSLDRRNSKDARHRKILSKQKKALTYQHVKLSEMSHELSWRENRLSKRIRSFLDKNAQGVEVDNARINRN